MRQSPAYFVSIVLAGAQPVVAEIPRIIGRYISRWQVQLEYIKQYIKSAKCSVVPCVGTMLPGGYIRNRSLQMAMEQEGKDECR